MSFESAKEYLQNNGYGDRIMQFDVSSATVELAAAAIGCEPCQIAKSLAFLLDDEAILIIASGEARIDNPRFKQQFYAKATMIPFELLEQKVGHTAGGVCPFGIKEGVKVYIDKSLLRFETVYPACGSSNSAVRLSPAELEKLSGSLGYVNVCKGWLGQDEA